MEVPVFLISLLSSSSSLSPSFKHHNSYTFLSVRSKPTSIRMYYCQQCEKEFKNYNGFNMHMEHSAAHQDLDYECEFCDRDFGTEQARHQHYVAAYGHHYCGDCRRTFNSEHSLTQVSQFLSVPSPTLTVLSTCAQGLMLEPASVAHSARGTTQPLPDLPFTSNLALAPQDSIVKRSIP
jgi:hypothetical protein